MYPTLDKVFIGCLLGGFGLAVLMALSAGALSRFRGPRLHFRPHLRLPRFLPRIRLPRVHVTRPPVVRTSAAGGRASAGSAQPAPPETTLFPPGTVPVFTGLFATLFGAFGLLAHRTFHLWGPVSLLTAVAGGVALTLLMAAGLWRYFLSGAEASELRGGSPIGIIGHVSLAIPAGGVGAVAFVNEGKRVTMPARGKDGGALPLKTPIMIVDIAGHTAVVEETLPLTEL